MKNFGIFILLSLLFSCSTKEPQEQNRFNFGFEKKDPQSGLPEQWILGGHRDSNYVFTLDATQKFKGKYSLRVEAPKTVSPDIYGIFVWHSPLNYPGEKMTLKAQIKTEDVKGQVSLIIMT